MGQFQQRAFLPPAARWEHSPVTAPSIAGVAAAVSAAAPATAADIDGAATKFADAAYPYMSKIDWVKDPVVMKFITQSPWTGQQKAQVFKKVLEAGVEMNPSLVRQAVEAHHNALSNMIASKADVLTKEDNEKVFVSIANMLKSAGNAKVKAIFDAAQAAGQSSLNDGHMALVGGQQDASVVYKAFLETAQAVQR